MSSDMEIELYRQLRTGQEKYAYLLLAAAASGLALVVRVTTDATLHWSLVPLGAAVLAWGASFFAGCRYLQYVSLVTRKNTGLLQAERGESPMARGPAENEFLAQIARDAIGKDITASGRYSRYQFRLLISGAVLFIVWHVLGIVLRS
jgi:hypothetical protein